ncbi:MAG: PDZ domain-containing protein, partial [Planctomycetaceae bacterium]
AAAQAGLLPTRSGDENKILLGDLILSIDGKAIAKNADLFAVLDGRKAGETVQVAIIRDDQEQTVPITLQVLPTMQISE